MKVLSGEAVADMHRINW